MSAARLAEPATQVMRLVRSPMLKARASAGCASVVAGVSAAKRTSSAACASAALRSASALRVSSTAALRVAYAACSSAMRAASASSAAFASVSACVSPYIRCMYVLTLSAASFPASCSTFSTEAGSVTTTTSRSR
ncbi:MAG: hypothetical protein LUE99_03210 [Bacteroides sp.]|nr:hypothetical protein [Bacteroides sp.]